MACRFISSKKVARSGMTFVELQVATAIGACVGVGLAQLITCSGRSFATMANYVSLDRASRNALDTMTQQIRQTNKLIEYTPTSLTFQDADGGTLAFTYDPNSKQLS